MVEISFATYVIVAGAAPLLAASIPFFCFGQKGMPTRLLTVMLGVSAGLLFAIATLDLIPEAMAMAAKTEHAHAHEHRAVASGLNTTDIIEKRGYEHDEHEGEDHAHGGGAVIALLGVGAGYFTMMLVEQLMSATGHTHSHGPVHLESDEEEAGHGEQGEKLLSESFSLVACVGLSVHSVVDGLVIAGAFEASSLIGARVALAIVLHKFPDGFVLSSVLATMDARAKQAFRANSAVNAKKTSRKTIALLLLVSSMTPLGVFLGTSIFAGLPFSALGFVLGFGAGTFIYITCTGIVPELLHGDDGHDSHSHGAGGFQKKLMSVVLVVAGYVLFLLIDSMVHEHAH